MKKPIIVLMTLLTTLSALAGNETYTNDSGCKVEVENRRNGVIYYVSQEKKNKNEVVGITNDLTKGTFAYCKDSVLKITSSEVFNGTEVTMSCSEHKNDNAVTRGAVNIYINDGKLRTILIDGQVKRRFLGWKQDTKIECLNLVKK